MHRGHREAGWGHIELNGRVLFDSDKKIDLPPPKRVGYLFQQYALFPHDGRAEHPRRRATPSKAEREQAVQEVLHAFHLEGLEQPVRVSFPARCLAVRAGAHSVGGLVLLGEPFSALDAYLKWQVELELSDI